MGGSNSKIIIFVGPYGSGKSQFIDCLTQQTNWASHDLQTQDHPVRSFKMKMPDNSGSVVLVDTPGFDEYTKTAEDILDQVNTWMKRNHKKKLPTGILYLIDIQDNRWTKPPPKRILESLNTSKHLIFVTTHWDRIDYEQGQEREAQIRSRLQWFLWAGAHTARFDNTTKSAWGIIESLIYNAGVWGPEWEERKGANPWLMSIFPVSRPPATSTSVKNNSSPEPSVMGPLHRLPATSTPETDDSVPSAAPEPSSIIVSVFRLQPSSTSAEEDDSIPSAPPELGSITVPLCRLPATSTTVGDDDFVPSIVPEPSSIAVPVDRLTATPTSAEDDDFVPATDPEPSSIVVPVFRSAASSTSPSDHFVSAART